MPARVVPIPVPVPPDAEIHRHLPGAYFFDAYRVDIEPDPRSAFEIYLGMVAATPAWVDGLMALRNRVVRLFGLKDLGAMGPPDRSRPASAYAPGERVGIFTLLSVTERELILGDADKHLQVRVSVCKRTEGGRSSVVVTTVVHVHNLLGRVYMLFVGPVHKVIAPAMMRRMGRSAPPGGPSSTAATDPHACPSHPSESSMPIDLAANLGLLIPRAIEWAEQFAARMLVSGRPLGESELAIARQVGVLRPEAIRLFFAPGLPAVADPLLREASLATGLLGASTAGLTLGHAVYIREGLASTRLLSHEFRHVQQYEQAGSIAAYLPLYLRQVVEFGYTDAPYEVDARAHEIHG